MRLSKYVKLGILMVFTITVLFWGLSYLKGHDFFKPVDYYYTRYDRVDGLQESSHVVVNGFRVGSVKNIEFAPDKSGQLIVTFMLDNDFKIPKNSIARIVSSDIMGTRSVKLLFSDSDVNHAPGDTIRGEIESDLKEQVSLQVLPIKNKAEELLSTLDSAITVLTVIFNEDARKNLSESFANINQTIFNLEQASADLQALMAQDKDKVSSLITNMESISGTLKDNSSRFDNVMKNLSSFSDSLAKMPLYPIVNDMAEAINSLQGILAKLNSDSNTAGLLFSDDQLYNNVTSLTNNLSQLLVDIRVNPKRYLHFSAIDLGKEVYVSAMPQPADVDKVIFKVHLISTTEKLDTDSPLFSGLGKIEEFEASNAFSYLTGTFTKYADAEKMLNEAYKNFPDATIVAFKDGKILKLEKALRMTRN